VPAIIGNMLRMRATELLGNHRLAVIGGADNEEGGMVDPFV
jgi:hypothetical protein